MKLALWMGQCGDTAIQFNANRFRGALVCSNNVIESNVCLCRSPCLCRCLFGLAFCLWPSCTKKAHYSYIWCEMQFTGRWLPWQLFIDWQSGGLNKAMPFLCATEYQVNCKLLISNVPWLKSCLFLCVCFYFIFSFAVMNTFYAFFHIQTLSTRRLCNINKFSKYIYMNITHTQCCNKCIFAFVGY